MNSRDVAAEVDKIRLKTEDDEGAHIAEDILYESVLKSIADGTAEDPIEMAKAALATQDIEFSRWYA